MSRQIAQGDKFGRFTVLGLVKIADGRNKARCECECGNIKIVWPCLLKNGQTQSCGCFQRERASSAKKTHGHTVNGKPTTAYRTWVNMLTRCNNPKATHYAEYGARGIRVCDRWMMFENFLTDMGEPPPGLKIDRIDNNGNYEPTNCRWANQSDQCRNRRSNRAVIRSDGVRFPTLAEAAQSVGGKTGGIWSVCNGEQSQHRGFGWRYA